MFCSAGWGPLVVPETSGEDIFKTKNRAHRDGVAARRQNGEKTRMCKDQAGVLLL